MLNNIVGNVVIILIYLYIIYIDIYIFKIKQHIPSPFLTHQFLKIFTLFKVHTPIYAWLGQLSYRTEFFHFIIS